MTRRDLATRLRGQLASADRSGAGKPFPADLRRAVVAFADGALADGESTATVARELGVSAISIHRWKKRVGDSSPPVGLCRVEVVAADRCPSPEVLASLVVHTPAGLRVEGLTVQSLVALVRAVG
jgi:transposase